MNSLLPTSFAICYGHRMKAALPTFLRHQYDLTAGISNFLLSTEAGAQTNWHRDFTGTGFLRCCQGQKAFLHFGKNEAIKDYSTNDNEAT